MSVGYSVLMARIEISGTSEITSNWNVYISSITVSEENGGVSHEASVSDKLTASFRVGLNEPGGYVLYDITVNNDGNLDAVLQKITIAEDEDDAIKFTLLGIEEGDPLLMQNTKTFQIKVEWDGTKDFTPNEEKNLELKLDYNQSDAGKFLPTLDQLNVPTYDIDKDGWATEKTVTIHFPARYDEYIYEYSINNGDSWNEVTEGIDYDVTFKENGTIIARVRERSSGEVKEGTTFTVNQVDSKKPTAPKISGGSDTGAVSREITITDEAVALSGVDHYQYYLSSSSTNQEDGKWIDLDSGVTKFTIDEIGTYYVFVRAINNAGQYGEISTYQKVVIELGNAVEYLKKYKTLNSIKDGESGLVKIDDDGKITSSSTLREYRFVGPSPDNYVSYNDSTWRIIKIYKDQLKLVGGYEVVNYTTNYQVTAYLNDTFLKGISSSYKSLLTTYQQSEGAIPYEDPETPVPNHLYRYYENYNSDDMTTVAAVSMFDYGLSTNGSSITSRNTCIQKDVRYEPDNGCGKETNWLNVFDDVKRDHPGYTDITELINLHYSGRSSRNELFLQDSGYAAQTLGSTRILRPTITLINEVEFTSGDGTKDNPYKIKTSY